MDTRMPRRPVAMKIDTLLLIALTASLVGLSLPWVSATLAHGGGAAQALPAGAVGPDAMPADATRPGHALWLIDLAAHWQLQFATGWALLLTLWCLRDRRARLRWLPLLVLAGLPWLSAAPGLEAGHGHAREEHDRGHNRELTTGTPTQNRDTQHRRHHWADPRDGAPGSHPRRAHLLRIAAANVHVANRDPGPLVDWLRRYPVDVLVVPELGPAYARALSAALPELPHRALHPRTGSAFGIGFYAHRPLRDVVAAPDANGILALGATLDVDGRPVRVVGVHPMPPVAPHWHAARDHLLHTLATGRHPALGPDRNLPRLVAGDLNATPWSSALHLASEGGLRRATGFRGTWPMPWGGYLGIPIDHVLGSAEWWVISAQYGPDIGSDHAPIRVEVRLAPSAP